MPNTNCTAEIIEFPGQSYRATIEGAEYWFDGTEAECLEWAAKEGATRIKRTAWK